jgi:glucokinase
VTRRIGIDVGGSKCLGVVVDDSCVVLAETKVATPSHEGLVDLLESIVVEFGPADHVGVGLPGLVTRDGIIRSSPNLPGAFDLSVGAPLSARIGCDVSVANDATCAAIAEWRCGAARGLQTFWMVTLGTGIGGGLVANGSIVHGTQGFAGEIGHMIVEPGGRLCGCGMSGCWERYASGSALSDAAGHGGAGEVFVRLRDGDEGARTAVEEWSYWVSLGLANLANAIDPEAFVLGGGVIDNAPDFLGLVGERLEAAMYSSDHRRMPRVLAAQLGPRAGAIGAALLDRD